MRDMLRQTTIELRDAQNQNVELRSQIEQMKAQQATAAAAPKPKASPAPEIAALDRARRELDVSRSSVEELRRAVEERDKVLAQWKQALEQTEQLARTRDADAKRLDQRQQDLDTRLQTCERDNSELVGIANELLTRYREKGVWDALRDAEPVTGIHRVKLETFAQQYHAKIVDRQAPSQEAPK
jgi:pyruvate/2-oxoglutarate dehydrogenase complex dihydrolipoamide acyltransferase (E2) component